MVVNFHTGLPAAFIRVTGSDAPRFLQSQFSNDIEGSERRCAYGLWLDRKGRVAADSFVLRLPGGAYGLFSYTSPAASIIEKLQAFIIADDVELADETVDMGSTSLWGEGTEAVLRHWGFRIPAVGEYVEQGGIFLFHGRRSGVQSYDLLYPDDAEDWLLQRLAEPANGHTLSKVTAAQMEQERLLAGIPAIPRDCAGEAIPQELGLEAAAVSFSKGCFIGQEVMARVRQTGRYTRQMVRLTLAGNPGSLPAPVTIAGSGEAAGELTSAAASADGKWLGLAMMRRKVLEGGALSFEAGGTAGTLAAPDAQRASA